MPPTNLGTHSTAYSLNEKEVLCACGTWWCLYYLYDTHDFLTHKMLNTCGQNSSEFPSLEMSANKDREKRRVHFGSVYLIVPDDAVIRYKWLPYVMSLCRRIEMLNKCDRISSKLPSLEVTK